MKKMQGISIFRACIQSIHEEIPRWEVVLVLLLLKSSSQVTDSIAFPLKHVQ